MRISADTSGTMVARLFAVVLATVLTLAVAAPASAQNSSVQGYDESGVIGNIDESPEVIPGDDESPEGDVDEDPAPRTPDGSPTPREAGAAPAPGSELPFTGFEAGMVALAGFALLGTGFLLRRSQRHPG